VLRLSCRNGQFAWLFLSAQAALPDIRIKILLKRFTLELPAVAGCFALKTLSNPGFGFVCFIEPSGTINIKI